MRNLILPLHRIATVTALLGGELTPQGGALAWHHVRLGEEGIQDGEIRCIERIRIPDAKNNKDAGDVREAEAGKTEPTGVSSETFYSCAFSLVIETPQEEMKEITFLEKGAP